MRSKGFLLTASDEITAIDALQHIPFNKERFLKQALQTTLSKNHFEYLNFEDHYTEFWSQLSKAVDSKIKDKEDKQNRASDAQKQQARFDALKSWLNLTPTEDEKVIASYSDLEVLTKKDFIDLSQEEMELMMRLLKKMTRKLSRKKSRLKKSSNKHRTLDLKKTIRQNLRQGGDIQHLVYSEPKEQKLKLVLLCDVSRSMDLYSRFFIHLIYAFQHAYDKIETFVFSTALHQVTSLLNNHEFDKAFAMISDRVPQWSGGTTIGSCLNDFITDFEYGLLDKKTTVLILSDGWDTGEASVIRQSMKSIYKKSKKVIWLNPLAGNPNFSPDALGMKSALPYIDLLASAHNLDSLKAVLKQL
ncbi:vWA domain-containing protein [Spongiivirga citrea]|uniref:VWA domain-containing protein n=1 Tax=Spongiivirga citrea TaxID=1481457 RepID=A0A6M0CIP7_9FLAO|nr:VWA domain-containing protein [Spongiivirga citrea]NER15819.1 VWA domain-containing protein [Spongiivirga citrea]